MDTQEHFKTQFDEWLSKPEKKKSNKKPVVALIGLGPHAKRIYLHYFQKHKVNLALVVELDSKKEYAKQHLLDNGFKDTKIFTIPDDYKDLEHLPSKISDNLLAVCQTLEITHVVIATEPKAHNMYVEFALKNNLDVMTDKPITVCKDMTNIKSINKVRKQYYDLLQLAENSNAMCKVMCQRQYHKGYEYIKHLLNDIVEKYQVPITYIDIYHCDGNWEMAHDLLKENHPYKFGYGKLFHSGYHFIDLLSDFIKINNQLTGAKRITKGEVCSNCFTPNDELNIFNFDDYKRIFKNQTIPDYYNQEKKPNFNKFGEKNFYGMMKFTNSYNQTITNVNLNLLHYGFSRRGWIETKDFYKKNGRIRHERINIQVGTLLNIQVHSYQSKEIKDRLDYETEEQVGGLEHFDIDIYRNTDIIGGKPFERITLGSLYTDKEKKNILGYNELSREMYLNNFFKGKCDKGDIRDQALAIEILSSCAMGVHNYYKNKHKIEKIEVRNNYTYPFNIKDLKHYSYVLDRTLEKKMVNHDYNNIEEYQFDVIENYIPSKDNYEVFISVLDDKNVVGGLLTKVFRNKMIAKLYFKCLSYLIHTKKVERITKIVEKYSKNK